MKILISGAGTAGLSIAYWLNQYGFNPTIVESAPELRRGGYKIDVRGKAIEVLRRAGAYEDVVAANTDMQSALLINAQGKVVREMSGKAFGHRLGDDLEIMRGRLNEILLKKIPEVEIIYGDSIQTISQTNDSIEIQFKNNQARYFDLLIGADGIHSNVRKLAFGDESKFTHKLGINLCVFRVPNYLNLDRVEMQFTEFGRAVGLWCSRGDKNATAFFAFVSPLQIDTRDMQQQVVKKVFSDLKGEIPKLLSFMPETEDFYFDGAAQIHMDHWYKGRVILIGDAAYCASPMSGQGTSLALMGAYVLAGELALAKGDYQIACHEFEEIMRPFINMNQKIGLRGAKLFKSQENSTVITWLMKKLMAILPGQLIEFFVNHTTKQIHRAANEVVLKNYL